MKAIVWTRYGPPEVLEFRDVQKPAPKEGEVLVKIHASTVTTGDCETRSLKFPLFLSVPMRIYVGFRKPTRITIPGTELAGVIEAVGAGVTRFKLGDPVFGTAGLRFGAYAEYICMPVESGGLDAPLAIKPANMTYEEAAAVPFGGNDALHFLRKANIRSGQKVLINGAGGSIGTFAVQLAKTYGAEVTGVDSTGKLEMLRSIGADRVIDYTREDFTQRGETYDVIFDTVGKSSLSGSLKTLAPGGFYLQANPGLSHLVRGPWVSMRGSQKVVAGAADHTLADLLYLKELCEAGKLKPVIDRSYPLEQIVEAHSYVETGQKLGNVVITVS